MRRFLQFCKKAFLPCAPVLVLLALAAAGLLCYVFTAAAVPPALEYGAYAFSAYALVAVCLRLPAVWRGAKSLRQNNKYLTRYFSDASLRTTLSLTASLAINTGYAGMQLWLGLRQNSAWSYSLAGYYALLAILRFSLWRETRKSPLGSNKPREYRIYRRCGALLLVMTLALLTMVFYIVYRGKGAFYPPIAAIAMAAYTFFTFTMAIVQTARSRRAGSPVFSAAKAVNLAAALVSMLSLETAMLAAFSTPEDAYLRPIMTASSGAAVCITVLVMACLMIRRATKALRRLEAGATVL